MKKCGSRGFTMTEVLVVLAIIVLLAAIGVPSVMAFVEHASTVSHSNIARSIFVAVQSELSSRKNSGTLTELSEFTADDGRLTLVGGYLKGVQGTSAKLSPQLHPDLNEMNQDAMYYMLLSKNGDDDPFLSELLARTDLAREITQGSVCVELNAGTGSVTAVFYSNSFDYFAYDSSNQENNLLHARQPSARRGVYQADAAGMQLISVAPPKIVLIDGKDIKNALYCEAFVSDSAAQHTIAIADKTGAVIQNAAGQPYALTFTQDSIREYDLQGALARPYTDLESHIHAGSVRNNAKSNQHTVFTSGTLFDPSGGTVLTHRKVVWVLDLLDSNSNGITFENSIHVKYPEIKIRDITARLNYAGSDTYFVSNYTNSYYAQATGTTYFLEDARHFSNMRYVATNLASPIRNFVLLRNIDFAPIVQFAPLNWVPVGGVITKGIFVANFSGIQNETSGFALKNIRIETNHAAPDETSDTGLFGVVWDSTLSGVCLENADIATRQGGNIGAIAGSIKNTRISLAAVNANVSVLETDETDYQTVSAGGLVGRMENSYIEHSYNSGSFSAQGHGALTVSGHYSDKIHIGGIAGHVVSGRVSTSYNNARVNIASAQQNGTTFQLERPQYAALVYTTYKDISIGGVVGKNEGLVQYCYSTNFVGDYFDQLDEANCGTIIGNNVGQSVNCIGLYNGVPYEMLGTNISGQIITPEELKSSFEVLGSAFQAGNLTARPGSDYHLAENYPYPVLNNNRQRFAWEHINSPIGFDLKGDVYFVDGDGTRVEAVTDRLHSNYVKIDLADPTADNYIDKLRIDVKYKGFSPLYARVQLEIFTVNRGTGRYIQPDPEELEYTAYAGPSPANALAWISSYGNDESFYYTVALRPSDDEVYTVLPFATGADADYAGGDIGDYMYLKVIASGVEPVKVTEFWNISRLPWR